MEINIKKAYCSKAIREGNSNIFQVNTDEKKPYYEVNINAIYFDVKNKEELINKIRNDLTNLSFDEKINNINIYKEEER